MKNSQNYLPENSYYKVLFRGANTIDYTHSSCILLISVGKKYHEAERLEGTIKLINKSGFKSCLVAVNDTLQRHNYITMTDNQAYNYSLKMGDEWLDRNNKYLNQLKPEIKIVRWNESLSHHEYAKYKAMIEQEYQNNLDYKNAIDATSKAFIDRIIKRDQAVEYEKLFKNGIEYLLEECPIIMPIWALENYDYIIYPKPMTAAMAMTRKIFVEPRMQDKAKWLALNIQLKFINNLNSASYKKEIPVTSNLNPSL